MWICPLGVIKSCFQGVQKKKGGLKFEGKDDFVISKSRRSILI